MTLSLYWTYNVELFNLELYHIAHLVWSQYTYPSMDRGCGDVVDKGAKIKSPDLQVFVCDHLHRVQNFLFLGKIRLI